MDSFSSEHHQFQRALSSWANTPRAGRTTEFADLFGTDEQQIDYIQGILIFALIISCFFLCWGIFICILKCMGRGRVGYLAGGPYEAFVKVGEKREANKRPMRGRIVFGISGVLLIIFTLTLLFVGLKNLEETTSDLATGAELGKTVFTDTEQMMQKFGSVAKEAKQRRDALVSVIQEYFETGDLVLPNHNATNRTTLPPGHVAAAKFIYDEDNLQEYAARVEEALYALDGMLQGPGEELRKVVSDGEAKCDGIANGLNSVELRIAQLSYGIPYLTMTSLLLILMALAAMGIKSAAKDFCVSVCVLPLFILMVVVLVLMTAAFSIGGIVNGDFCSGGESRSPDETMLLIMSYKLNHDHSALKYRMMDYLVHGCSFDDENLNPRTDYPLEFANEFDERLEIVADQIKQFAEKLNTVGLPVLERDLNINMTKLDTGLSEFREKTRDMLELLGSVLKELACQRLYDVYYQVIHEATCHTNYTAVAWTFASFLVMSLCGWMMIMFRAVLYPVVGIDEDDFSWNNDANVQEIKEVDPTPNEEVMGGNYVRNDGLDTKDDMSGAPMGGKAQQRFEAVGDENPFEDGNNETFAPKKSAW